jgi:uncharacterized protein
MPEYRTSSYVIYVDLPDDATRMLLVHGYSGAYDVVSRPVAQYLRFLEARRAPKPLYGSWSEAAPDEDGGLPHAPSPQTLQSLVERGYLTALTVEEEIARFDGISDTLHRAAENRLTYVFMPTYDCNLRCAYCFQDHMRTDAAYAPLLRTMTPELIDRIFVGIRRLESERGMGPESGRPRDIGLFGGEPLLAASRPAVEHILRSARADGPATFWAISNATELDAYADLLGPDGIGAVQITLDGPGREHDRRRIYPDGSGSFARIARNIELALSRGVSVQVRMNVDRGNIDELPALVDEMTEWGWVDDPNFLAYAYPIHAANEKTDRATTFTTWELDLEIERLREAHPHMAALDRPDERIRRAARSIFAAQAEPGLRAEFCGAHSGMYIFDALGDIYACWERTGDVRLRIGQVNPDGRLRMNLPVLTDWRSRTVSTVRACQQCRYALHCGGGCAVLAEGKRGTKHANYCDGFANRFRAMVGEAFLRHEAGEIAEVERSTIAAI